MAANTDLVRKSAPNFATTLSGAMLISDTSLSLTSATGLPTTTAITLVIDATDPSSGASTPTLKEVVTGTLSGTTVSNLLRGQDGSTQQAHASGANVVMWITSNLWNDFCSAFLVNHTQLGAFNSSLSFTTPSISTPTITSGGTWAGSPTISTPTIADLSNMTHAHTAASSGGTIAFSALTGTIATAQYAAGSVTSAKTDSSVVAVTGGGNYKTQSATAVGSNSGDVTVTFSPAFSATPVILCQFVNTSGGSGFISITASSASSFTFATLQAFSTRIAGNCNWIAIGT